MVPPFKHHPLCRFAFMMLIRYSLKRNQPPINRREYQ